MFSSKAFKEFLKRAEGTKMEFPDLLSSNEESSVGKESQKRGFGSSSSMFSSSSSGFGGEEFPKLLGSNEESDFGKREFGSNGGFSSSSFSSSSSSSSSGFGDQSLLSSNSELGKDKRQESEGGSSKFGNEFLKREEPEESEKESQRRVQELFLRFSRNAANKNKENDQGAEGPE